MLPRFFFAPPVGVGDACPLEPHAVSTCDLGVGEKTYTLRVRNELLYFSVHPQSFHTPVWTTFQPVPAPDIQRDAQALLEWWRREVEGARFGLMNNSAVWGCHGFGQYRAWWDAAGGEPFEWPMCQASQPLALLDEPEGGRNLSGMPPLWVNRARLLSERVWYHPLIPKEELDLWQDIPRMTSPGELITRAMNRPRPPHLAQDCPLEWRSGSLAEFEALSKAILHNVAPVWKHFRQIDLWGSSHTLVSYGDWRVKQSMTSEEEGDLYGWCYSNGEALLDVLFEDFAPRGWEWKRDIERWYCRGLLLQLSVPAPTSEHERIEARLLIRDWLADLVAQEKLSAEDAELLLHWPTDAYSERWMLERERILEPFEAPLWND